MAPGGPASSRWFRLPPPGDRAHDDEMDRRSRTTADRRCRCSPCRCGEEILEAAEEHRPALTVLLDVLRLVVVGPTNVVESGFHDAQTRASRALLRQGE